MAGDGPNVARGAVVVAVAAFSAITCLFVPMGKPNGPAGVSSAEHVKVTRYGSSFNGRTMGCGGTFHTWREDVVAVPLGRNREFDCGEPLTIVGPCGLEECTIYAYRLDTCGGCPGNHFDLADAGLAKVCLGVSGDMCYATLYRGH